MIRKMLKKAKKSKWRHWNLHLKMHKLSNTIKKSNQNGRASIAQVLSTDTFKLKPSLKWWISQNRLDRPRLSRRNKGYGATNDHATFLISSIFLSVSSSSIKMSSLMNYRRYLRRSPKESWKSSILISPLTFVVFSSSDWSFCFLIFFRMFRYRGFPCFIVSRK